jgi:acetyl-CoA acyltransferase
MRDAVIVEAVRTPIGRKNGAYREVHPVDLSACVLQALAGRAQLDPAMVEDIIWGVVSQIGEQTFNTGRNAVLAAGWPEAVPGVTIDRHCGSSQQAVAYAAATVIAGLQDVVVAGGVESMTRIPINSSAIGGPGTPHSPHMAARYQIDGFNQGLGAEIIAEKWGMSRTQLDEFSAASHERAASAADAGLFENQHAIVPDTGLHTEEGIRRGTTVDTLSGLKPAFKADGVIHAGNASQLSDGSGALLIMTSEKARDLGMRPLAHIHSQVVVGDDPVMMLSAPISAPQKVLHKAGLSITDIGAFEVNEAFASVPLAWLAETGVDPALLNPVGGAIAVGHPLGGSGAILMTRLLHHMMANQIRFGLQTTCEGGGMANATVLELL